MRHRYVRLSIDTDAANGKLISYVSRYGQILGQEYSDGHVRLDLNLPTTEVQRVINLGGVVVE